MPLGLRSGQLFVERGQGLYREEEGDEGRDFLLLNERSELLRVLAGGELLESLHVLPLCNTC